LDRELSDLLEEGRIWRKINVGVKTAAACLGEFTVEVVKETKQWQPV